MAIAVTLAGPVHRPPARNVTAAESPTRQPLVASHRKRRGWRAVPETFARIVVTPSTDSVVLSAVSASENRLLGSRMVSRSRTVCC